MEDETETEASPSYEYKPTYVLVALDTHPTMFKNVGAPSAFRNCIKALYQLSDHLLLKSNKGGWSPFAVTLCDRDDKASLVNFTDNMIDTTKLLKQKSTLSEEKLKSEYMRDYDVDLAGFLQLCKKKFKDVSANFYKRILIFITNNPDPTCGDSNRRFTALNEAKNFYENSIIFQLVVPDENFEFDTFYTELSSLLKEPPVETIFEDEGGLYEKLSSVIWFRQTQRKLSFYPFPDDTSKYFTVYLKSYLNHKRLINNSYVATDGTALIKSKVNNDAEMSNQNEYVMKNKTTKKKFTDVTFDIAEKLEIQQNLNKFPTGFTLLFVSDRITEIGEVVGEPKIIDADSKDEVPYFKEFWQYCVNKDKVLVCARNLKKGDKPRAVELIPKLYNKNKVFLVAQIPFANEIFHPKPKQMSGNFSKKQKEVTQKLVDKLKVSFSSNLFPREQHLRKENYVKSKLLDEPRSEIDSPYVVNPEDIDEKLEEIVDEYLECFPPVQGVKRKSKK